MYAVDNHPEMGYCCLLVPYLLVAGVGPPPHQHPHPHHQEEAWAGLPDLHSIRQAHACRYASPVSQLPDIVLMWSN
jgi:hypothetical protein